MTSNGSAGVGGVKNLPDVPNKNQLRIESARQKGAEIDTEDESWNDSTNNKSGKVKAMLCPKSGPPVIETPGDIGILVKTKRPVSAGAKIPGCSHIFCQSLTPLYCLLKLSSPSSNQRLVVEHLHQSQVLCHDVVVALTSGLYPTSQTVE